MTVFAPWAQGQAGKEERGAASEDVAPPPIHMHGGSPGLPSIRMEAGAAAGQSPAMRVLVVDDSERVRRTLATGLRKHGMTVETAADGAEALTLLNGLLLLLPASRPPIPLSLRRRGERSAMTVERKQ